MVLSLRVSEGVGCASLLMKTAACSSRAGIPVYGRDYHG